MTTTDAPDPCPDTLGYRTHFVEFATEGVELTPDVLNRPRYGRPDPNRYLPDDERPPETPKR